MLMDELPLDGARTPESTRPPTFLSVRYFASPRDAIRVRSVPVGPAVLIDVADWLGTGGGGAGGGGMSGMSGLLKHMARLLLLFELFLEEPDNRTLPSLDPDQSIWIG